MVFIILSRDVAASVTILLSLMVASCCGVLNQRLYIGQGGQNPLGSYLRERVRLGTVCHRVLQGQQPVVHHL